MNKYPNVTPSENPEIYKNNIIDSLYRSNIIHKLLQGAAFRNYISPDTDFASDAVQETFLQLCKQSAERIIKIFEKNPDGLVAFAETVGLNSCIRKHSKNPDFPNHSLLTKLFFTSTLKSLNFIHPCDYMEDANDLHTLVIPDSTSNEIDFWGLWVQVSERLTDDEIETFYASAHGRGTQGRIPREFIEKQKALFPKIKKIAKQILLNK